jgi:hypothetical protein
MKPAWLALLTFFLLVAASKNSSAQVKRDTSKTHKHAVHSPRLAAIMSAAVPGSGQFYNKKYWKLPVVYAGLGGLGYLFYSNRSMYTKLATEVRRRNDTTLTKSSWDSTYNLSYSASDLLVFANQYRRKSELSAVGLLLFYSFQIVDAYVDAHLFTFDISDDLSLNFSPALLQQNRPGIAITLRLSK